MFRPFSPELYQSLFSLSIFLCFYLFSKWSFFCYYLSWSCSSTLLNYYSALTMLVWSCTWNLAQGRGVRRIKDVEEIEMQLHKVVILHLLNSKCEVNFRILLCLEIFAFIWTKQSVLWNFNKIEYMNSFV